MEPIASNIDSDGQPTSLSHSLMPVGDRAVSAPVASAAPSPLAVAHRALRGRYFIAIPLGLLCAALSGSAAWRFGPKPQFRSEGLIRFPSAREDMELRAQSYEVFMQSQLVRITSRGMVETATTKPAWLATKRGGSAEVLRSFAENLQAEVRPKTEYIRVMYSDGDPVIAAAGVSAVIDAYAGTIDAERTLTERIKSLEVERDAAEGDVKALEGQRNAFVREFGTTNLDSACDEVQQRIAKYKGLLSEIDVALAADAHRDAGGSPAATRPTAPTPIEITPERIASVDGTMRSYLDERYRYESKLLDLKDRFGDAHPAVVQAEHELDRARTRVEQYAKQFEQLVAETGNNPFARSRPGEPASAAVLASKPRSALLSDKQTLTDMEQEAKEESKLLYEKRFRIQGIEAQLSRRQQDLAEKNQKLVTMRAEASRGNVMEVVSKGVIPLVPARDVRSRGTIMGALVGGSIPFLMVIGLSLTRQTFRYSDETRDQVRAEAPLLAILPVLVDGPSEDGAAQSVHQLRVMLQLRRGRAGATYLLSSAAAGEGKTSLAIALGLSFAASGSRTVIVDADWVAQRLTRGFNALSNSGLREAVSERTLKGHLRRTTLLPNLCLLPAGKTAGDVNAARASPDALCWLVAELRQHFDVVLFDSGPILGSIEASILAPAVDEVLFVISRGQQQVVVTKSMERLASLGSRVAGFVFNRARRMDFVRSGQASSSYRSAGGTGMIPVASTHAEAGDRRFDIGALGRAVLRSISPHPEVLTPSRDVIG